MLQVLFERAPLGRLGLLRRLPCNDCPSSHRTGRSSVLASPHGRRSPRTKNRPWLVPNLKSAIESPCSGLTSGAPPGGENEMSERLDPVT